MSDPQDVPALIAPQAVASAILAPYIAGLLTQVLLIGAFLVMFGRYAVAGEIQKHGFAGRLAIWTVFALVLCCLGVSYEEIIDTGISQKRSSDEIFQGPPQSNVLPVLSGLTAAVCQFFLAGRAASKRLHRVAFFATVSALTTLAFVGSLLFSATGFQLTATGESVFNYKAAQAIWLWASAAVDLLISIALSHTLHSRIAHFNEVTDSLLKRLIVTSLQTAAYTSVISIIGPLPALHAISLYTTLSTRRSISDTLSGSGQHQSITGARSHNDGNLTPGAGPAFRLSTFKRTGDATSSSYALRSKRDSPPPLQVNVQREQTVSFDVRSEYDEEYSVEKAERL
ncbi:hypothetical protein BMF94_6239 [Rhodotorula taiwanensis]|uniref:Proteophosphoglycan ppg4 n=1 Tax=Rhodotorula taiwanensis TaxID=741276 RepID=A0A2S5B244_9BASI|nr:hypothetical protein BMF94_6239 [Rhodotorula taiwanensis]